MLKKSRKKRLIYLVILSLLVIFTSGCRQSTNTSSPDYPAPPDPANRLDVGVSKFENDSEIDDIGTGMSNMLVSELLRSGWYDVMTREEIDRVLAEQGFQQRFADPSSAVRMGKLLGVKYLIFGSVVNVSSTPYSVGISGVEVGGVEIQVKASLKMIDVETGRIVAAPYVTGIAQSPKLSLNSGELPEVEFGGNNHTAKAIEEATRAAISKAVNRIIAATQNLN